MCGYCRHAQRQSGAQENEESAAEENFDEKELGQYKLLRQIAKGGMGEIFLAYDPICRRNIALKRIRADLQGKARLKRRFLREAWITSHLSHPGVIPIYNIHVDGKVIYYTMPYVEGETLRDYLKRARKAQKDGVECPPEATIPALTRSFLTLCQTIAYSHAHGVIHRDLKPDNIMLGRYGEVALLDWGLAKWVFEEEDQFDEVQPFEGYDGVAGLTIPGRVFGTLTHLAPECCFGQPASVLSDIYALGVILYQILSLHLPFDRPTVEELEELVPKESFVPPSKLAPYRDVPILLSRIAERSLKPDPTERYQSADSLIHELEAYLEGQSEWFEVAHLDPRDRDHWEMAEYVFLPQRLAVTGTAEGREWAKIMISRDSFPGNVRLSARFQIQEEGEGLGFLINIGEEHRQLGTSSGYCMWLSTDSQRGSKLFRGGAEVCEISDLLIEQNRWYDVRIEKVGTSLYLYINDQLIYSYITYLPILGTHVGLLYRDTHYELEHLTVAIGNLSIKVDCLAIPDAFLAAGEYERALSEYRRIGYSFPDRTQGREAMFRAGVTLLEEAKREDFPAERNRLFQLALEEFEQLHDTPGAPLEYLGKSLVYIALGDIEDEVNSLELALRRYRNHPLLSTLREQIRVRLFETSRFQRDAAYRYALLTTHLMPEILEAPDAAHHIRNLRDHWELLPFLLPLDNPQSDPELYRASLTIPLAFWLAKPYVLLETLDRLLLKEPQPTSLIANLLFCLLEIGCYQMLEKRINRLLSSEISPALREICLLINILTLACEENPAHAAQEYLARIKSAPPDLYAAGIAYLMERALKGQQPELVHYLFDHLPEDLVLSSPNQVRLDGLRIWAFLIEDRWQEAGGLLSKYPLELIDQESTILRSLYGCWLAVTEGEELAMIHFSGLLERRYPRSWLLMGHFLAARMAAREVWEEHSFLWERRQLYRQLTLYSHCIGHREDELHYRNLERQEYLNVPD
jgi:eukaryotic-like serine/threonine-protein kinase